MLICLDIGNTSTSFGCYQKGRLGHIGRAKSENVPEIVRQLLENARPYPKISLVISSVSPEITRKVRKVVGPKKKRVSLWIVGENLKVSIRHKYKNIHRLGSDRLVNIYGGIKIYGPPLLIFDYGTAVTCDYVSEKGIFLGGLIIPGPEISLKALCDRAVLLPSIDKFPKGPTPFLGRDTKEGMKAGVLRAYGAMTDGLVQRFRERFGRKFRVIATGGLVKAIVPYASRIDILDPLLTVKSLVEVFKDHTKLPT